MWLDDLLHPIDIAEWFVVYGTVTSHVGPGDDRYGLSACTGQTRMSDAVGDDANLFFGVFSGQDGADGKRFTMPQHVADQATVARAIATYRNIVGQVQACQHEPAGHWYYGAAHHLNTSVGTVTWMVTFDGDGTRAGGIAVARSGRHQSVMEADGAGTFRQIKFLAGDTLARVR